ncbi:MAG: YidC/Oxa1 family membrane protein insertase, partial [Chloroflexota bacterium]|nr:YidC/Oxa1 family membrane protein insertase [Chloroflexota bacterium]
LYSEHRVNPMAGCLPMLIQIPIFFGVYQAIVNLSRSEQGEWAHGFLWLNDLGAADPWKVLPIAAGVFQFIQTKMMRPAHQKVTDPQQAMMNTMMNFMPLTVILFGWGFASGAVVYWVAQSVFSVVQQWFITGWGSMKEWVPSLPELPEHRRIGYRPPRCLDEVVVMSGDEDGASARPAGAMGWFQRKMEEAQQQAAERSEAQQRARSGPARADGGYQAKVDAAAGDGTQSRKRATGQSGSGTRRAPSGRAGNAGRGGKTANGATERVSAAGAAERPVEAIVTGQAGGNGRGTAAVPRKSRPVRKRDEPTPS